MDPKMLIDQIAMTKGYFDKTIECLDESDSDFAPAPGMYTAANQVAHVAHVIDWFVEGAFRPEGFDMDFESQDSAVREVTSLVAARQRLEDAVARFGKVIGSKSSEELMVPLPADGIMGGAPRMAIVNGIIDHTAHHRGALSVYARARGKTPTMPYM